MFATNLSNINTSTVEPGLLTLRIHERACYLECTSQSSTKPEMLFKLLRFTLPGSHYKGPIMEYLFNVNGQEGFAAHQLIMGSDQY